MKKLKRLFLEMYTVPVQVHRYKTIDDYVDPAIRDDTLYFSTTIGNMNNTDYEFITFMHAITEQYLCYKAGISDDKITRWDKKHIESSDPGDIQGSPYRKQHRIATLIEKSIASALKVNWDKYEAAIEKALDKYPKGK